MKAAKRSSSERRTSKLAVAPGSKVSAPADERAPVKKSAGGATKSRKTVTLDSGLLRELESRGGSVSAQVNEFIRQGLEWEQRQAQILELVADYEAEFGEIEERETEEWERRLA